MKRIAIIIIIVLLIPHLIFAATESAVEKTWLTEFIRKHVKDLVFLLGLLMGTLAFFSKSKRYASKNVRFMCAIGYGVIITLDAFTCIYHPEIISMAWWSAFAFSVIGFVFGWLSKDTHFFGGDNIEEIPLDE